MHAFQRRAALAADNRRTIATRQRIGHRLLATRTVVLVVFLNVGHVLIIRHGNIESEAFPRVLSGSSSWLQVGTRAPAANRGSLRRTRHLESPAGHHTAIACS